MYPELFCTDSITLELLAVGFTKVNSIRKKNRQKYWSNSIEISYTLVVSEMISLLLKTVDLIKIGVVSSKFCLVLCGIILFVVPFIYFLRIFNSTKPLHKIS